MTCTVNTGLSNNVAGLPMEIVMTDNGNGTYEATYTIVNSAATVTVTTGVLLDSAGIGI